VWATAEKASNLFNFFWYSAATLPTIIEEKPQNKQIELQNVKYNPKTEKKIFTNKQKTTAFGIKTKNIVTESGLPSYTSHIQR
tara:strand:+ start:2997 stop:3245 length:249 start_codon:yes stop_codon:yes gene_type:complete